VPDPAYRVFLFGSRATGSGWRALRYRHRHGRLGLEPALAAIHDELEEAPTLYTIEVVDFARVSQKFRRVAEHRIAL
jgi:hypothetical protein